MRTWNLCAVLCVLLGMAASGCQPSRREIEAQLLEHFISEKPGIDQQPQPMKTPKLAEYVERESEGLILSIPKNWEAPKEVDDNGSIWIATDVQHEGERVRLLFHFQSEADPSSFVQYAAVIAGRHMDDVDEFLRRYPTDLALQTAAMNTVPADLEDARGRELQRTRALLDWKVNTLLQPVVRMNTGQIHAFILLTGELAREHEVLRRHGMADLFDASGRYRGLLAMRASAVLGEQEKVRLMAQVLSRARFSGESPE